MIRHLSYISIVTALPVAVIAWHYPCATDNPVRREDVIREFHEIAWSAGTPVIKNTEVWLSGPRSRAAVIPASTACRAGGATCNAERPS